MQGFLAGWTQSYYESNREGFINEYLNIAEQAGFPTSRERAEELLDYEIRKFVAGLKS